MLGESIYLSDVIVGMIIFLIWKEYNDRLKKICKVVKFAFILFSICLAYVIGDLFTRENGTIGFVPSIMLMLANILMIMGILLSDFLQKALGNSIINSIGTVSFEFYLFHWIIICSFSSYLWLEFDGSENSFIGWLIFVLTVTLVFITSLVLKNYVTPYLLKPIENRILCSITK